MLIEKPFTTIPISRTEGIRINAGDVGPYLLGPDIIQNHKDYWNSTGLPILLMMRLFNISDEGSARILGDSHISRSPRTDDLLELFINSSPSSLGIYVTEDGKTTFDLHNPAHRQKTDHGKEQKKISTCTVFGDSQMTAEFLREFASKAKSKVQIDGPTEEEPIVVMTTPNATAIGEYGENGEIIGVVFRQISGVNSRSVHGTMELLVRKKEIVSKLLYNRAL